MAENKRRRVAERQGGRGGVVKRGRKTKWIGGWVERAMSLICPLICPLYVLLYVPYMSSYMWVERAEGEGKEVKNTKFCELSALILLRYKRRA